MSAIDKEKQRSIARGLLVAAIASTIQFTAFTLADEKSGLQGLAYAMLLLLIGAAGSLVAIVILALPALIVLMKLQLANMWSALIVGLMIGAAMASMTEWPQSGLQAFMGAGWNDHAVRRISVHAMIGAISALCFWRSWSRQRNGSNPTPG